MLLVASVLVFMATLLRACAGDDAKGDWGEACVESRDCKSGLTCGLQYAAPYCTSSCEGVSQCPSGWSCAGVCRKP